MPSQSNDVQNSLPKFIYGTAWKEDATERLTLMAIKVGFRGIDTANQRRHYVESAVGEAIAEVLKTGIIRRDELFIQSKYTYADGQDHRIPYDPRADYPVQVRQSFESSLKHLQTEYVDSFVLHGPSTSSGLTTVDWNVWRTMEAIHQEGGTRYLGVSNIRLEQLSKLFDGAGVKPAFVQNRCFAQQEWDRQVRDFCVQHNIIYQGFSLLTANQFVLSDPRVKGIAEHVDKTPAQVVFRFAIQVGMMPLTGTTSPTHMKQDLECVNFTLSDEEVEVIERIVVQG